MVVVVVVYEEALNGELEQDPNLTMCTEVEVERQEQV